MSDRTQLLSASSDDKSRIEARVADMLSKFHESTGQMPDWPGGVLAFVYIVGQVDLMASIGDLTVAEIKELAIPVVPEKPPLVVFMRTDGTDGEQ